jgi:AbrB family looped-hinge helix DNA binding protein
MPSDVTTLSEKFQISIPKAVREAHGFRPGQRFAFISRPSGLSLVPVPELDDLIGMASGANPDGYRDRNDRF